jgi:hypothetical protein
LDWTGTRLRSPTKTRHAKRLLTALLIGIAAGAGLGALLSGVSERRQDRAAVSRVRTTVAHTSGRGHARSTEPSEATRLSDGATAPEDRPVLDAGARASFAALQASLPGRLEIAVAPLGAGAAATLGDDTPAHGWSTTKVPVLAALLAARDGALTPEERRWAEAAITESDNQSVLGLFDDLEHLEDGLTGASDRIQQLLRSSGDDKTVVATAAPPPGAVTTFGQTEWSPSDAVKFFSALGRGCLLAPESTRYVLDLMQRIEPSESWGLGSAGFAGVAFKGGWGPEPTGAYLVRQSGLIDPGSPRAVGVAIIAFPPAGAGSFETGTEMLTRAARWLREHLRLVPRAGRGCS